jgi:predicted ATP-dependent endonuclease of OLD family
MAKIHSLKINNYRGIKKFDQVFGASDFICLIGRGDSGKTTILHAINAALTPNWNYTFNETDFYNRDLDQSIKIEVNLYDLPIELLTDSKYGLYKRLLNSQGEIIDDLTQNESEKNRDLLTIRLIVSEDLEPKWYVVNNRPNQEDVEIRANDRAKLNVFLISDFIDRHFSWSKGSPLYSLLKVEKLDNETDKIISKAYRDAKNSIDSKSFTSFDEAIEKIKAAASTLGISIENTTTSIDFKHTFIKEGNVSLHEYNIPFRMKGKGSKRLVSMAIQLELAEQGGIILIDELEQGLEPDRAKFLAKKLKEKGNGQVFCTSHSRDVLVELKAEDIFLRNRSEKKLIQFDDSFQGVIRANPEAFFAKKVIVCEGPTEVGICRALNDFRVLNGKDNLSSMGIAIVDGKGNNFINYCEKFNEAGFKVSVFCDSDVEAINNKKEHLKSQNIKIIDTEKKNHLKISYLRTCPGKNVKSY